MTPSFWSGKKVFVTGHTGFKGSWCVLWLQSLGAEVTGFALPPVSLDNLFDLVHDREKFVSIVGDIRDSAMLTNALRESEPEIVIHMAAQPLVRKSFREPVETFSTNVMGTVNLLDAVRQVGSVRAVVNVTSDKCYENKEWLWGYREIESMGGSDPYSCSKGCAELITAAYRRSFFDSEFCEGHRVSVATARSGNVVGGGDYAEERLVPDVLRAIASNQSVGIRNPLSTRPWQHVLEPLSGYLLLAEKLYTFGNSYAGAFNFGPANDDTKTVEWIVSRLVQIWGGSARWHLDSGSHVHEASQLRLDCSKARELLGWTPCWDLDKALHAVVDWNRLLLDSKNRVSPRDLCLQQIAAYSEDQQELIGSN